MDKLIIILFAIAGALLVSLLFSLPVMLLWNGCLVGAVAGISEITWMQAWGISILTGIMFKETSVSFKK
jgi:hypothetical protein